VCGVLRLRIIILGSSGFLVAEKGWNQPQSPGRRVLYDEKAKSRPDFCAERQREEHYCAALERQPPFIGDTVTWAAGKNVLETRRKLKYL
jgi:hypothetical protein